MSKRRLGLVLGLGLALAVLVSACGVALGPVQFTAGGPVVFIPATTSLHLPDLQQTAGVSSMHEMQNWRSIQEQALSEFGVGHCHGVDHGGE